MTTEPKHAAGAAEEQLRPLLQEMLAGLRRHRDTPLQEGIDSAGIVREALRASLPGTSTQGSSCLADLKVDQSALDGLIAEALRDEAAVGSVRSRGRLDRPAGNGAGLAGWLEQLHTVLHATHPTAVEIVALRIEDCPDREIAQRLGLGLRLVQRIIQDLRQARQQVPQKR